MIFSRALKLAFSGVFYPYSSLQFPSGHMQSAVVLYGWIALKMQNIITRLLIIILLTGIGGSLVYSGYHDYIDVLAGVFFGVLLISLYYFLLLKKAIPLSRVILICTSLLILYIGIRYKIENHVWMAYYALLGFMLSKKIFCEKSPEKNSKNKSIASKIIMTAVCFSIILAIKAIFSIEVFTILPGFLYQIQWVLIAFSIPACGAMVDFIRRDKHVGIFSNRS